MKEFLGENPDGLEVANIPNKALAIVSEEKFEELKRKIEDSFRQTLIKMYEFAVKHARDKYGISFDPQEYIHILEDYFKITVEKIPFRNFSSYDKIIDFLSKHGILDEDRRKWFEFLKEFSKYPPQPTELYPVSFEILESATNIESSKFEKREQVSGWKCKLCGENLAILGDKFEYGELMRIWKREPLCPICLVKRFYRKYLEKEYKEYDIKRFETVTDVCLRAFNWIEEFKKRKEHGKFIEILKKYNLTKDDEPCDPDMYYLEFWNADPEKIKERIEEWCGKEVPIESVEKASIEVLGVLRKAYGEINEAIRKVYGKVDLPPKYYAILKLDGDEMGKILSGRKSSKVSDYAHEALKEFFDEKLKEDVKRALSPSHHIAISQALSRFAVEFVRRTVKDGGDLIYAGGDDVLAILPIDKAFACAKKLADYFSSAGMFVPWKNGGKSGLTMSGGLLIVHYKHPLYDAIDRVNKLEKRAKSLGRNALAVGYLKRSGSYDEVVVSWDVLSEVERLVELLKNSEKNVKPSLSRRIIYHVVRDVENLPNDENAVRSFIRYEISRHYSEKDVDQLVDNVMKASEKVRVELVKEDIGLEDEKIASRINGAIAECKQLSEIGIPNDILGIVVKKQVKGLFLLLKILSDCKAELWGGKNESDIQA